MLLPHHLCQGSSCDLHIKVDMGGGEVLALNMKSSFDNTIFCLCVPKIFQYVSINYFFSIVVWSYYAYFVAVVLNAMAPSPAEQVPLLFHQFGRLQVA